MSLDTDETVEIELVSGSVVGVAEEHRRKLKKAILKGINDGTNLFIRDFINQVVAKETGTLRAALITEIRTGVLSAMRILDVNDDEISFEISIPDYPEYAERHLDGSFGSHYKHPTTEGTRPLTMEELAEEMGRYISEAVLNSLTATGFDYT